MQVSNRLAEVPFTPLGMRPARAGRISAPSEQAFDGNVLVEFVPIEAQAAQLYFFALSGRAVEQAGSQAKRNALGASV